MLRADLPTRGEYGELAVHLLMPLLANDSAAAVLIVVGGTDTDPTQALPHRELISGCTARFASRDLPVPHRFWAASTITGSDWRSYDNPECAGNVLDSGGSAIACACAAEGKNKYGRREDLAAALAPVAEQVLAQRADLLSAASTSGEDSSAVGPAGLELVEAWVERAASGTFPQSDEDVVALAVALADHAVRDACLDLGSPGRDAAGELLWTTLVRNTPAPERAEAAGLLAFAAYKRGHGVLATIATRCGLEASPSHRLCELVDAVRSIGLPPARIRRASQRAAGLARAKLAETASEGSEP
jgi:hypothetical protein